MDKATERILEKTRQRREHLDKEIMRSASISPKCSSVGTCATKRKSSDRSDSPLKVISNKNAVENEPNTKRPSFDENDKEKKVAPEKPLRSSLYPTDQLEEMRKPEPPTSQNDSQTISNDDKTTLSSVIMRPSTSTESRRARFAALSAQLEDFEVDMNHCQSPCNRPKSEFMRGPAPRQYGTPPTMRHNQMSNTPEKDEAEKAKSPLKSLRFAEPVAAVQMSFMSDETSFATVDTESSTEEDCGLEAFCRRKKESPTGKVVHLSAEEKKVASPTTLGSPRERPVHFSPKERQSLTPKNVVGSPREKVVTLSPGRCQMAMSAVLDGSPRHNDAVRSVLEQAKKAVEAMERNESQPSTTKTTAMAGYWENRVQSDAKHSKSKLFWESEINIQKKQQMGIDIKPAPQSTKAPPAPPPPQVYRSSSKIQLRPPPPVKATEAGKTKEERQEELRQIEAGKSKENRNGGLSRLRNRWELSSATGVPIHPDKGSDDLVDAAARLAASLRPPRVGAKIWEKQQALFGKGPAVVAKESPKRNTTQTIVTEPVEKQADTSESDDQQSETPVETEVDESPAESSYEEQGHDESLSNSSPVNEEEEEQQQDMDVFIDQVFEAVDFSNSDLGDEGNDSKSDQHEALQLPNTPLIHSVSFYRNLQRQQRTSSTTATPVIIKPQGSPTRHKPNSTGSTQDLRAKAELKVQWLNREVNVQQEQIAQASRALNLCRTTEEFKGSREEVDAQRALLLATERRRCLLTELDRVVGCQKERKLVESDGPLGTLTISHITVPLKREFVNDNFNRTGDLLYYFICLMKYREHVFATQMVTSDEGLRIGNLELPHYIQLKDLAPDFAVRLEIFALRTKRETFSHEEKYRIKGSTLKGRSKAAMYKPGFYSPGGPVAVLDPSFQQIGHLDLTLRCVNRAKFRFEGVQFSSPVEGGVYVKLRCFADGAGEVEQRGFLSMYEEVSGFGSWTRLWCLLKEGAMRFWRYPDDEPTKEPLVSLDLSQSLSRSVTMTKRDECARPLTFQLDLNPDTSDVEQGIKRDMIRVLLSADTKEDCSMWSGAIDATLRNLHMWNPDLAKHV